MNVITHVIDSNLLSLWNRLRSPACVYMPFNATTIIPDRTHYKSRKKMYSSSLRVYKISIIIERFSHTLTRGSTWKNGAIHSKMIKIKKADTTEAIWLLPPVCSCINERDKDVAFGTHENAPPTILLRP